MTKKMLYDTGSDVGSVKVLPEPPLYVPKPRWQAFPGFSFLFENPGEVMKEIDHYALLQIDQTQLKEIDLYAKIEQAVERIDPDALAQRFHFFTLPSSTYHVTVWDGINKGNMDRLDPDSRQQFLSQFEKGIQGVTESWPPLGTHTNYSRWFDDIGPIRLRYRRLRSRGSTVLVVELEPDPDDHESCMKLKEILKRRKSLDEMFADYGKPENYMLRPHVAIGYFSDAHLGDGALYQFMDIWMSAFDHIVKGSTIEFKEISLYAFTDMITYFKPIQK